MPKKNLDPERGREVAALLKELGVQGILVIAAEQGYITELSCQMPVCLCPKELGGEGHFDPMPPDLPDWMPTFEHDPTLDSRHKTVETAILAHRLCNRVDAAKRMGRPYPKDLARVEAARLKAIEAGKGRDEE
jgi:hypothetical protein